MRTLWVLVLFGSIIIHHCFTTVSGEGVSAKEAQPSYSDCKPYVDAALKGDIPLESKETIEPPAPNVVPESKDSESGEADGKDDDEDKETANDDKATNEDDSDEDDSKNIEIDESSNEHEIGNDEEIAADDDDSAEVGEAPKGGVEVDDDESEEEHGEQAAGESEEETKAEEHDSKSDESGEDDKATSATEEDSDEKAERNDRTDSDNVADDSDESNTGEDSEEKVEEVKITKKETKGSGKAKIEEDDKSDEEEKVTVKTKDKKKDRAEENEPKHKKADKKKPKEDDGDDEASDEKPDLKPQKKSKVNVDHEETESKDKSSKKSKAEDDLDEESEEKPLKKAKRKAEEKPKKTQIKAAMEEDDDSDESEESYEPRSREHIERILGLDHSSDLKKKNNFLDKVTMQTLKELKSIYEFAIKPLETLYKYRDLSNRHFGDPEIFSKPMVVFMGPWSGGKSTIINWLLGIQEEEHALRTGADPSPAQFNIMIHGDEEEVLDGTQLAADWTFSGLQKFGQSFLDRLRGRKLPNRLLEKVNLVEIPGILEIRKQVERSFPFNDACQWFIDRADVLFLVYDPAKLDIGPETEAILDQLKGRESQVRIVLNKADSVKPDELLRVQATLIWNISPLMASAEPPVLYAASLWDHPLQPDSPTALLIAHENLFLKDISDATEKRVETRIAAARRFAVRVRNHAKMCDCYLTTYNNHRSFFSNKKRISDDIIDHPQNYHIYEGLSTLTNISRYDLPDPETYRDFFRLNPMWEFPTLASTCTYFRGCPINKLDVAIAYDLPELLGRYRRQRESILSSPVGKLPTIQFKDIPTAPIEQGPEPPKGKARWYKTPPEGTQPEADKPKPVPAQVEEQPKGKARWYKTPPEDTKPTEKTKSEPTKSEEPPVAPKGKNRWWKEVPEPEKPKVETKEKEKEKKAKAPPKIEEVLEEIEGTRIIQPKNKWYKPYREVIKPKETEQPAPKKNKWWKET